MRRGWSVRSRDEIYDRRSRVLRTYPKEGFLNPTRTDKLLFSFAMIREDSHRVWLHR